LDYDKNERWVKLKTAVERGTYIRKLAHDMGEEIGIGIHMGDLRRIQVGVFTEKDNFISSEKLAEKIKDFFRQKCLVKKIILYFQLKKYFYPMEEFFRREKKFEKIFIKKEAKKYILAGNSIR
jgi:tRNA U55 pseudouridine synthase TruB